MHGPARAHVPGLLARSCTAGAGSRSPGLSAWRTAAMFHVKHRGRRPQPRFFLGGDPVAGSRARLFYGSSLGSRTSMMRFRSSTEANSMVIRPLRAPS